MNCDVYAGFALLWVRRLWRRRWWEPEKFWGAALGGWWCLHPGRPAEETWPAQRSSLSHSEPQLSTKHRETGSQHTHPTLNEEEEASILSRYSSFFIYISKKRSKTTFSWLTQTGACVGSLHYGLLVQHRALRQWQISSHPCNRDPTKEASYHITSTTVPFQEDEMNLHSLVTKNKSSSSCVLSTMKHDRLNPTDSSGARSQCYCTRAAAAESHTDCCTHLPSNLCFRKSNKAFCIMSVT